MTNADIYDGFSLAPTKALVNGMLQNKKDIPGDDVRLIRLAVTGPNDGVALVYRPTWRSEANNYSTHAYNRKNKYHSGHYDMSETEAFMDYNRRVERGW